MLATASTGKEQQRERATHMLKTLTAARGVAQVFLYFSIVGLSESGWWLKSQLDSAPKLSQHREIISERTCKLSNDWYCPFRAW